MKNASAIHYTSEDEYLDVHKRLKLDCEPIIEPNGISIIEYNQLPVEGSFVELYPHLKGKDILLFLGRLSWKKGIDLVIKSLPKIIENNKNIHFVIVGNDEDNYKSELIELIKSLKLSYVDITSPSIKQNEIINSNITWF